MAIQRESFLRFACPPSVTLALVFSRPFFLSSRIESASILTCWRMLAIHKATARLFAGCGHKVPSAGILFGWACILDLDNTVS